MNDISHHAPDTRFPGFLFHNTPDTVAISVITFRDVFKRFQTGCFSVISSLTDLHLGILFFQLILNLINLFFQSNTFVIHRLDHIRNLIKFQGNFIFFFCKFCFFTFQSENLLTDLCLTNIQLFHHGIKTLCFTLGCGTTVQDFDNLVFAFLHSIAALFYIDSN